MRWDRREIDAPATDTLSAAEVAVALGYSSPKSVMQLVERGEFPEPVMRGTVREWLWEDVVWYRLHLRIRARLRLAAPPAADDATPIPDAEPRKRKSASQTRDFSGKLGKSGDSGPAEPVDG